MRWVWAAAILLGSFGRADVTEFRVLPSATDPAITGFDSPHWVYVDRDIVVDHKPEIAQDRGQLLVWIPGTGAIGRTAKGFLELGAELGYHVVSLMYPDDIPATVCSGDPNPNAFETFRMAIIQGGDADALGIRKRISISPADSIESRLLKLIVRLQQLRPRENWDQFLNGDGSLKWESIAVAGQSQGGGHAALIGIKHSVARVLCFGAPKDYSRRLNASAAWYGEASATPKSRFFAFNHQQDPIGCTPQQLLSNLQALGLGSFGGIVRVDDEAAPFQHARILYTAFPELVIPNVDSDAAKTAHGSSINTVNSERWRLVWTYMLTEPG